MTNTQTGNSPLKLEHHREDGKLIFNASFFIDAPPREVLSVLYGFDHLDRFMTIAPSVELLSEGEGGQEVQYTYRVLFLRIEAKFRRLLREAANEIEFELTESRQNISWLPRVAAYRGHYRLHPERSGCVVEYFQEIGLAPKVASWILPYRARKQLDEFVVSLKHYLEDTLASGRDN